MHADMTAVTIQSNQAILNEIEDTSALPEPSYRKKVIDFLVHPIISSFHVMTMILAD